MLGRLADWVGVAVGGDADHMHVRMNIDSGRVRVDDIDAAAETGTGTASDLSRDFLCLAAILGLAAVLGLIGFLGCSLVTTMDVSGSRMRVLKTTRPRAKRVLGTFEVFPTGIIPRRENPAWQVANDKVEASRARLQLGHKTKGKTATDTRHQTAE